MQIDDAWNVQAKKVSDVINSGYIIKLLIDESDKEV